MEQDTIDTVIAAHWIDQCGGCDNYLESDVFVEANQDIGRLHKCNETAHEVTSLPNAEQGRCRQQCGLTQDRLQCLLQKHLAGSSQIRLQSS